MVRRSCVPNGTLQDWAYSRPSSCNFSGKTLEGAGDFIQRPIACRHCGEDCTLETHSFSYGSYSPPYTFFLLNGDMELHRNRHLFI